MGALPQRSGLVPCHWQESGCGKRHAISALSAQASGLRPSENRLRPYGAKRAIIGRSVLASYSGLTLCRPPCAGRDRADPGLYRALSSVKSTYINIVFIYCNLRIVAWNTYTGRKEKKSNSYVQSQVLASVPHHNAPWPYVNRSVMWCRSSSRCACEYKQEVEGTEY